LDAEGKFEIWGLDPGKYTVRGRWEDAWCSELPERLTSFTGNFFAAVFTAALLPRSHRHFQFPNRNLRFSKLDPDRLLL
jgi:hypothetical protein